MALVGALLNRRTLWAIQLATNALLAAAVWLWLSVPEATVWQLAGSAWLALLIISGELWLQGVTLASFRDPGGAPPFVATLRRIPALFLWFLTTAALAAVALRYAPSSKVPWLPEAVAGTVVLLLLPLASQVAGHGFRGFVQPAAWRPLGQTYFYAGAIFLVALGIYVPYKLIWWIPTLEGIAAQTISLGVRFFAAYLIATTAWFTLTALVSRLSARHGG
ncbi:MAG: hypothetical protein ABI693_30700 [Bryobacteraceae bacterium]